jgi:hypothetical protein
MRFDAKFRRLNPKNGRVVGKLFRFAAFIAVDWRRKSSH